MKRPASHLGTLWLVVSVAIGWCGYCAGQSAPPDGENDRPAVSAPSNSEAKRDSNNIGAIPYRRVFVPDDGKAEVLSRDCRDCRPVKAEEFEALLRAAAAITRAAPGASGARLRSAEYSAQFRDGQLLAGQAELEIVASAARDGSLALEPLRMAIGDASWDEAETMGESSASAARIGATVDGTISVLLPRPPAMDETEEPGADNESDAGNEPDAGNESSLDGESNPIVVRRLRFPWTLRGEATELGDVEFRLSLPPSPTNRLRLSLPVDKRPVCDTGIVTRLTEAPAEANVDRAPSEAADMANATKTTQPTTEAPGETASSGEVAGEAAVNIEANSEWLIELGGYSQATIRITTTDQLERGRPLVLLTKQQLRYELSPRGLQMTAELGLDVHYEPLSEMTVTLATPLQLIAARNEDRELEWNAEFTDDAAAREVTLRFPQPVIGSSRKIRLTCIAPIVWDERWRLPALRVNDARWQQGQASLEIPDGVLLKYFDVQQGREIAVEPLPNKGQLRRVQLYAEQPWMEVVVSSRAAEPEWTGATHIHFNGSSLSATAVLELSSAWGDVYEATALVPKAWLIDAIEALTDDVGLRSQVTSAGPTSQRVQFQFQKPVSPKQPVRVRIRAHREAAPAGRAMPAAQMRLVDFGDTPLRRHLWAITTDAGFQVRRRDDLANDTFGPVSATERERELLPIDAADLLVLDTDSLRDDAFLFVRQLSAFSGELLVTAEVDDERLNQQFRVQCYPRSTPLRRVQVHLSEPLESSPIWTIDGSETPLAASRVSTSAATDDGGETWEIALPAPRSGPFVLNGRISSSFHRPTMLALASLPEADSQVGRLLVTRRGDRRATIEAADLTPIPVDAFPAGEYVSVLGKYRYEPSHSVRVRVAPESAVARTTAPRNEADDRSGVEAWIWRHELETHMSVDGSASHLARLRIENQGRSRFAVSLPSLAELKEVRVAGVAVMVTPSDADDSQWLVELPAGERWPVIEVAFVSQYPRLRDRVGLQPVVATFDLPVLEAVWRLQLPPSFAVDSQQASIAPSLRWRRAVRELLFGAESSPLSEMDALALPLPEPIESPSIESPSAELASTDSPGESNASSAEDGQIPEASVTADSVGPWETAANRQETKLHWHAVERLLSNGEATTTTIRLVHLPTRRAFGWAALLMAAAIGWRIARTRMSVLAALLVATWAAVIVGPISWAVVFTGALLGLALGLLLVLATPVRSAMVSVRTEDASTVPLLPTVLRVLIVASVGSAALWCSTNVLSDDTPRGLDPAPAEATSNDAAPRETAARRPTPFRVYIPVDEDGQPTNDYVYLPRPFYDALAKQAAATTNSERGFQIISANYEGQLTRRVDDDSLNVSALTATYRITTFAAGAEIVLPLRRAQTSVTALQLDGLPMPVNWDADATSVTLTADQPGEHRLEVFMQPRIQSDEATAGIELTVPPAARSRLSLSHPGDVPELRFPSAIGSVTRRLEIGETQVELGAARRLAIQWPLPKAEPKMPTELSADQYVWLQVRPTSVLVEARVTFRTSGAPIRVVQMRVDPRLNPLPLDENSPVVDQRVTEGDPRQMRLLLDRDYDREVSLRLQFLWEPAAGEAEFHALSLPRLSPVVKQIGRYWLAASLPTGIVASEPVDDGIEPLDPDSFAASWGEASSAPTLAFALAGMDVPISLPLRRQATPILADQQLDISINARAMELTYRAQLNAVSLDRFQYRFDVPRGLEIQSAIVRSDVTQRVRPALDGEGHLTIFLSERLRGEAVIQLVGTLPTPLGKEFETPAIHLLDVSTAGHRTRVYRQSDVSVQSQPAMEFAADSAVAWHTKLGRLVFDWVAPAAQPSEEDDAAEAVETSTPNTSNSTATPTTEAKSTATPNAPQNSSPGAAIEAAEPPMLRVTQNQPRVRARMVTELAPLDDAWQASLEVLVDVAGGFIDQLRLEVPPQWSDVVAVDAPGVAIESRMAAGQSRGQIVIRPAEPIRGEFRLRLRGDLPATSVDIVLVPDATLLGVTSVDRYVILPTDLQRKRILWEISGLRETELPDDYVFAHEQLKSHGSYQVIGQTFQAKIAHVERTQSAAQVRLADITVRWTPDGRWFGSAAYDLEPGSRKQCAFEAPADCRIINAIVDDLPVRVMPQSAGGFAIPLGSRELPQRIEIVFTCDGQWEGQMERRTSFVAPMPIDIPVERTLWTVIGEPSDMARRPQLPGAVSAVRQEAYRLESVSSLIDLAADVAAESGGTELDNWYRRWSRRLARSQSRLDRWVSASSLDATSSANAASAADLADNADTFDLTTFLEMVSTKQNAISERLRVGEATKPRETHGEWVDLTDVTLTACGLAERAESDMPNTATVARAMFVGARERLEVRYESRTVSQFWQRVALMLVIGGLLLTLAMLRSHVPLGEWCARWPYLFGVLAGLAWWLWLPPSFLGWVIVAISMIGAVRLPAASQRWPRVTDHGTTVIRNGG